MLALVLVYWLLQSFAATLALAKGLFQVDTLDELGVDYNCPGGNIYFVAHPVDALLYQNPDLYHDVHAFKCTTLVVFTAGDRGVKDASFTNSLERGLEASYDFMAGAPVNQTGWDGVKVICGEAFVTLRYPTVMKGLLLIYLRFPDGGSDGQGFKETGQMSLKKLYQNQTKTITSIDRETTYDLNSLKHLISTILIWKMPQNIRTLDHLAPIAEDGDHTAEHADHSISARIVHDVVNEYEITGNVTSYGGNLIRKFDATLANDSSDFSAKSSAYFEYAQHDKDMCNDYEQCLETSTRAPQEAPEDVKYTAKYLAREYYAS